MKKNSFLVAIIVLISLITVITIYGNINVSSQSNYKSNETIKNNEKLYTEPPRTEDIPDYVLWNPYKGVYYDSNVYDLDENTGEYTMKEPVAYGDMGGDPIDPIDMVDEHARNEEWVKNKLKVGTNDPLDIALIEYNKALHENIPSKIVFSSECYSAEKDPNFYIISDLGIDYVPEMVERVLNNEPFSKQLLHAVALMTKLKPDFRGTYKSKVEWIDHMYEIIDESESKVKNISKRIKENELKQNDDLMKQLKAELDDLGIFAYPYINEEIKAGNKGFESIGINRITDEENEKIIKVIQKLAV